MLANFIVDQSSNIITQMNIQQSGRQLADESNIVKRQEYQLIIDDLEPLQQDPNFFSKFLCLHHIRVAFRYFVNGVNTKNIFRYDKDYDKFISTTRLRDIAMQKHEVGQDFNGFLNLLSTELVSVIIIVVLSLMVSACSVVAIYYQQSLVKNIIIQKTNEQYKYFGIIVGVVCLRFFLYNYLSSLTNNIAINIKVTLQNYYMRIIFMVDNDEFHTNLYKFRYLDIQSIVQGVVFLPTMRIYFCTIIGLIVLIFVLDGNYGFIIFGIFVLALIILIITLVITYKKLREREESKTQNTKNGKFLFQSLTRMLFENLTDRLIEKMIDIKKKDLNSDRFVNRAYIFIQFVADASIIVPIIILYGLYHDKHSILTMQDTYLTAVYLSMIYFPAKLFVYGSFFVVKAMQNYFCILKDFKTLNKKRVKDLNSNVYTHNHHVFFDNVGECFKYQYQIFHMARFVSKQSLIEEMQMVNKGLQIKKQTSIAHNFNLLPIQQSNNTISLCNYLQCQKQMHHFIESLTREIPVQNSVALINENPFLMPQSFKENIILYSQFNDQNKMQFQRILELVGLQSYVAQSYASDKTKLNGALARLYSWHEARLQLARALFHKVDFLIINKFILTRDIELMRKVIIERQRTNKVTIIVNHSNLQLLKMTRKVVFFTPNKKVLVHSINEILEHKSEEWNLILNKLTTLALKDRAIHDNTQETFLDFGQPQPLKQQFKISNYAKYFSLVHPCAILVIILIIAAPPCFKFYDSYLVGQSLKQEIYPLYLIFAVIYFFLIFCRGLIFSGYLRAASKNLFCKLTEKYKKLNGVQIINLYKSRDTNIQNDFRKIDNDFFMNFELGFTSFLQGIVGLVILACGLPVYLAMAMPVTVVTSFVNFAYNSASKNLQTLKGKHLRGVRNYVNACTNNSFQLFRYKKFDAVQKRFQQLNRTAVLFAANQMWILSGMRIIGQIIILVGLIIFLIIMINTQKNQVANLSMVGLGVSLFLNLNSSYRFGIKTWSLIGSQLTAVSRIWSLIDDGKQNSVEGCQIKLKFSTSNNQFETISYKNVVFTVGNIKSKNINFTLNKNDRIAVSCDSYVMARIIFFALNPKIPDQSNIEGNILVNLTESISQKQITVMYMHDCPLLPIEGTVFEGCKFIEKELKQESFDTLLQTFFKNIGVTPLFHGESQISELPMAYRQILNLFKVCCLEKCDILVIMNGLDDVPILARQRIEKYLIKSDIPIVISISNLSSIVELYPRHFSIEKKELKQVSVSSKFEGQNNQKL